MELKEFIKIFKKYSNTFWLIVVAVFLFGFVWYDYQSELYLASLSVNISREGQNQNKNYQYDQFYRLQADEKFGRNIINWIGDPGFMEANRRDFKNTELGNWDSILNVKANQLSSNFIKVEYKSKDSRSAVLFSKILKKNLEDKNESLNTDSNKNWFKLVVDDVYVVKNRIDPVVLTAILVVMGSLLGMLGVLLRHYFNFSEDENRN